MLWLCCKNTGLKSRDSIANLTYIDDNTHLRQMNSPKLKRRLLIQDGHSNPQLRPEDSPRMPPQRHKYNEIYADCTSHTVSH